jgi:dTDP-4-dehydrorhamnose 3,5-epimerase
MRIQIESQHLNGLIVIKHEVFYDARGFFMEVFREDEFQRLGLPTKFVQDNHSRSTKNVLRGLHFQWEPQLGKMMRVTQGTAFLVAVDIRKGSPSFGKWYGREVSVENKLQIWAPAGFARGFCVLSDTAEIQYKCTGVYNSKAESGILWNDPEIGIVWPVTTPIISAKDQSAQTLKQWSQRSESHNFTYLTSESIL